MKRRQFVEQLGIGSAVLAAAGVARLQRMTMTNTKVIIGRLPARWPAPRSASVLARGDRARSPRDRDRRLTVRSRGAKRSRPVTARSHDQGRRLGELRHRRFSPVVVYAPGKDGRSISRCCSRYPTRRRRSDSSTIPQGRIYRGLDPRLLSPPPGWHPEPPLSGSRRGGRLQQARDSTSSSARLTSTSTRACSAGSR